jgi:ribonuclease P protein component
MLSRYIHHSSPDSTARLGLVIAKRNAQLASSRNAIKRVIRESFRVRRHQLPPGDYIVRLHKKIPDCTLTELKKITRQEVDSLFDSVK